VVEHVGALDPFGLGGLDRQLYLAEELLLVEHVDQDVVRTLLQSVVHADYLQQFGVFVCDPL
jgi:hypothetical protein